MNTKLIALASAVALAIGSITGCATSTSSKPPADTPAQKRQNLDAAVDAALAQLYAQDPAARELVAKSRAALVFPSIVTAGFVVGGSYGEGALRVGGQTARYYKTAAGSVGLLAGAESKAMYILFMTDERARQVQGQQRLDGRRRRVGGGDEGRCQRGRRQRYLRSRR